MLLEWLWDLRGFREQYAAPSPVRLAPVLQMIMHDREISCTLGVGTPVTCADRIRARGRPGPIWNPGRPRSRNRRQCRTRPRSNRPRNGSPYLQACSAEVDRRFTSGIGRTRRGSHGHSDTTPPPGTFGLSEHLFVRLCDQSYRLAIPDLMSPRSKTGHIPGDQASSLAGPSMQGGPLFVQRPIDHITYQNGAVTPLSTGQ